MVKRTGLSGMSWFGLAIGAIALSGCETYPGAPSHPLDGTSWRLVEIDKAGVQSRLNQNLQTRHTISFERGGDFVWSHCRDARALPTAFFW